MKKVYINPGHSDKDPGAVGYEIERELNVKTAEHMRAYLAENYRVELMVTHGSNNSPYEAAEEANAFGADLFVSIHNNAGGGDGYEALVSSEAQVALGKLFESHVKAVGQNSRGVKLRPGLIVLRNTKMSAILNEGAFVDNKKDIADWNEDGELKKLGIAYAKAAAEYLQLEKKQTEASIDLPVLAYGHKGETVKVLQILLHGLGYKVGATGNFGSGTREVLKKAQQTLGIPETGKADETTWKTLLGIRGEEESP